MRDFLLCVSQASADNGFYRCRRVKSGKAADLFIGNVGTVSKNDHVASQKVMGDAPWFSYKDQLQGSDYTQSLH